jgi:hypothetical protein
MKENRSLSTFELGMNEKALIGGAPAQVEQIWLAADLAVFDILLAAAGGFIDGGFVPLPTAGTLE